ncbi:hypothetical protein GCM10025787_38790 [Saccharopolyspora rosea]
MRAAMIKPPVRGPPARTQTIEDQHSGTPAVQVKIATPLDDARAMRADRTAQCVDLSDVSAPHSCSFVRRASNSFTGVAVTGPSGAEWGPVPAGTTPMAGNLALSGTSSQQQKPQTTPPQDGDGRWSP